MGQNRRHALQSGAESVARRRLTAYRGACCVLGVHDCADTGGGRSYLVAGVEPLDHVAEIFALQEPTTPTYKTLGGFVIDQPRRIPDDGDSIELPVLRIEVTQVERGAIMALRPLPKPAPK